MTTYQPGDRVLAAFTNTPTPQTCTVVRPDEGLGVWIRPDGNDGTTFTVDPKILTLVQGGGLDRYVKRALEQIDADIEAGVVPADVPNFAALEQYVDENMYGSTDDDEIPWADGDDPWIHLAEVQRRIDVVLRERVAARSCRAPGHDHENLDDTVESFTGLCGDCGRATHYDDAVEAYVHDDPQHPGCFLIPTRPAGATPCHR